MDDANCFHMIRLELKTSVYENNVTVVSTVTDHCTRVQQAECAFGSLRTHQSLAFQVSRACLSNACRLCDHRQVHSCDREGEDWNSAQPTRLTGDFWIPKLCQTAAPRNV